MKHKVLIVAGSQAIRFLLKTIFGKKYQVILVEDGCSAIQWLSRKNLPDLIIADTQLPDMVNGELIEYVKSSELYGGIPLIALSSLDKLETRLICEDLGIEKFYTKPFNPIDLQHAVEQLIAIEYETSSLTMQRQLEYLKVG